jgi:hypothetical protein
MRSIQVLVNAEIVADINLSDFPLAPNAKAGDIRAECERIYEALGQIAYDISEGEYDDVLGTLIGRDRP